jgi:hypothetical protein
MTKEFTLTPAEEQLARRIDCPQKYCTGLAGTSQAPATGCIQPTSGRPKESAHSRRFRAAVTMAEAGTLPDPPNHADSSLTADSGPGTATPERRVTGAAWRAEGDRAWRRRQREKVPAGADHGPFDD